MARPDESVTRYHPAWFTRWVGGAVILVAPALIAFTPPEPVGLGGWLTAGLMALVGVVGAWVLVCWIVVEVGPTHVLVRNIGTTRFRRDQIRKVTPSYSGLQFDLVDGRVVSAKAVSRSVYAWVLRLHRRSLPIIAELDHGHSPDHHEA